MALPSACPSHGRNRPTRALLTAGIALLAALASACGGAGQRGVNGAATATAAASATAAAIPVVVGVTATQTQTAATGHPHIAATVTIRNQTARPVYVVGNTCSNYVIVLDIGDGAGQLLYRRRGAAAGCIDGTVQDFVAMTIAPGATNTNTIDADLTIIASKIAQGQPYTVRANVNWRSQDGTYLEPNGPPVYEASSDLFTLTLR